MGSRIECFLLEETDVASELRRYCAREVLGPPVGLEATRPLDIAGRASQVAVMTSSH